MCASQEILLFCKEMNTCETNQKAIKYFAFRVVGKIIPNGTKTKSFAFGNLYKYAPIKADTIPDAPTIGFKSE